MKKLLLILLLFGLFINFTFGACYDCWRWSRYGSYSSRYSRYYLRTSPTPYHYLRWIRR